MIYVAVSGNNRVQAYNAVTGAVSTSLTTITGLSMPAGLALSGNTLFVSNENTGTIRTYDATTGAPINASFLTGFSGAYCLTVSGSVLYVSDMGNGTLKAFNIGTASALAGFAPVSDANTPSGIAVYGNTLYVANNGNNTVGEYNAASGAVLNASAISSRLTEPDGLAFPVPEPSTWAMMGVGVVSFGLTLRRQA